MPDSSSRSTRQERRRHPRIKVRGRVNGRLLPLNDSVVLLDMSRGGFSMQTRGVFSIGALCEFRLKRATGPSLRISARVVHSRRVKDRTGATHNISGLEFTVDMVDVPAVQAALDALMRA